MSIQRNPFFDTESSVSSVRRLGRKRGRNLIVSADSDEDDECYSKQARVEDSEDEKQSTNTGAGDEYSYDSSVSEQAEEEEAKEDGEDVKQISDSKFRYTGKHFGLTYSQVGDITPQEVFDLLTALPEVSEIILAREPHKDGGFHYHAYGSFNKKRNIKNPLFWDVTIRGKTLHPNVKFLKNKAGVAEWKRYCCKGGAFLSTMSVDLSTHKNFEQRMKDFRAWKNYCAAPLAPLFTGSNEEQIGLKLFGAIYPDLTERRRSFWIWGPSEIGKTTHIKQALSKWPIFYRVNVKFPYEGYNGEEFILVDDKPEVPKDELIHMLNGAVSANETPVYGETRYQRFFLRSNVRVRYFILSNEPPTYGHEAWFSSRFTVLNVISRIGEGDAATWIVY